MAKESEPRGVEWWGMQIHTCNVKLNTRRESSLLATVVTYKVIKQILK